MKVKLNILDCKGCYSHGNKRVVKCGSDQLAFKHEEAEENFFYKCDLKCDKLLQCGNHRCKEQCHQGDCGVCPLMPSKLVYCPCGKTQMKELLIRNKAIRTSCLDPVLVCDKKCEKASCDGGEFYFKKLKCYFFKNFLFWLKDLMHLCQSKCHVNECPPCRIKIKVKCRCGKDSELVDCCESKFELIFKLSSICDLINKIYCQGENVKFCNRRCQKKKSCGRHQCKEMCCNDRDHICPLVCNRLLNCEKHKCDQLCHKGLCQRCLVASKFSISFQF